MAAALTVLRAFHVAGRPRQTDTPLGSFEEWSRCVRGALVWLGRCDPVGTMDELRALDPALEALTGVMEQWRAVVGTGRVSARELIERATRGVESDAGTRTPEHPDLREALLAVAGGGDEINSRRFGKWLGTHQGRVVGGHRIVRAGLSAGTMMWRLDAQPAVPAGSA